MSARTEFTQKWATRPCLAVGVGDWPSGVGDVLVDMDLYRHSNFIQADACHLPFKSKSFVCVTLEDCIEHMVYPEKALLEATRVASGRVIVTAPWDSRFPTGQHIEAARAEQETPQAKIALEQWYDWQRTHDGRFISKFPEEIISHGPTINTLSPEWLEAMIAATGWVIKTWEFVPENGTGYYNWLLVLEPS